jgi:MinD-like ATPase involved in chromosome partitioning or flagellar assembly
VDLPTYTNIWRIEKRLYKLYDFRLPMPLPINWIAVFTGITLPYVVLLIAIGLPFNHTLLWLYVLPPGLLTWLTTRPVIEGKRLPELVESQVRYLTEPRTWVRLTPLAEKDQMVLSARVWRGRQASDRAAAAMATAAMAAAATASTTGSSGAAGAARGAVAKRGRTKARVPAVVLNAAPVPVPVRDHGQPASRPPRRSNGQVATPGSTMRPRVLALGPGGGGRVTPALPASRPEPHPPTSQPTPPRRPVIPAVIEGVPVRARTGALGAPPLEVSHDRPSPRPVRAEPAAPPAATRPVTTLPGGNVGNAWPSPARPLRPVRTEPTRAPVEASPAPVEASPAPAEAAHAPAEAVPAPVETAPASAPPEAVPAPAEAAHAPAEAVPAPVEAAPMEATAVDVVPADVAPVEVVPVDAAIVDVTPVEVAAVETPVEGTPEDTVPVEPVPAGPVLAEPVPVPVEAAVTEPVMAEPVMAEPAPVEAAPAEPVMVEPAPTEPAPTQAVPVEVAPVEVAAVDAAPADTASAESTPWPPEVPAEVREPAPQAIAVDAPVPEPEPVPVAVPAASAPVGRARLEHSHEPAQAMAPVQETQNRAVPSIERALSGPSREQNPSWHGKVKIVTGAGASHGPGARDQEALDRNRARLDVPEPRRILVLGCTGGAGQTVTALMTGYMLASLREHPVAVVDLHDGTLARYRAPAAWLDEILAGRPPQQVTSSRPDGLNPTPKPSPARLDVIASHQQPREGDEIKLAVQLNRHYPLTVLDPGPSFLTRLLKVTDQLVVVVPANAEAAGALADTRDWLDNNGHAEMAMQSVTVINGVSRRSLPDVEHAESIARGRSRAIVRIPWDDMLPVAAAGPSTLRPQTRVAYTALAGVLVAGLAAVPVRKKP